MNFRKSRVRSKRNSMSALVNSEKWRSYAKRISNKGTEFMNSDSDDDDPKYNEIKDWVREYFERKSSTMDKLDQDVEVQLTRRQTMILSTLVPDELLLMKRFEEQDPKRFVGVLLMADVSGYTALSERYSNTGKGGTYRLTVTLNTYLGSLIELIYSHGGDILKFAGDAFLALWKTDKRSFLCHTIHTAIVCALIIQHSYSSYETDVKVNLRVKLGISAGNLIFAPIGSGFDLNYVIIGLPVLEAKAAESVCASGEVKLTANAWAHCYSRNYDHVIHSDGHVTIKSILYDPRENDVSKPFLGFSAMLKQIKRPLNGIENLPDFLWEDPINLSAADSLKKSETLSLRKSILLAEENNIGSEIRKFMIRPVLTQIDAHQPLEYLTEMRQVSILFVTLKPREFPFQQLVTIVNNAYQITCEIVYKSMGCVNKIILFDKDIMILVIFGLRGFKHESEAQVALKCAYSIRKSLATLDGVLEVSIGVTTGQVYCGVVGHPLRREFTVIGAVVNKAARLMCKFHNKVTCDETTFIKSKMSSNGFTLQPDTELKGIGKVGKIYEYTEEMRVKELFDIPMTQPLLDRNDIVEHYSNWIEDSSLTQREFDALLIVGESRLGKTRLLEWMARYARNKGYHVCFISLSSIHSASPYLALSQIINQILNLKEPIIGFQKEEKIVQLMKIFSDDLCCLNNIIKVRFAYHESMYIQDEKKRKEKAKVVFTKLITAIDDVYIIFLDDLQNLDTPSWEFISLMFSSMKIYFVMAVARGKFNSINDWLCNIFMNDNIRKMVLGPLEPLWVSALACQILDVTAVPKDLCDALILKCNGWPGLIESFITHLYSTGAIELKQIQESEIPNWENENLVFPQTDLLHPQALDVKNQQKLDELISDDYNGMIQICIVTDKNELETNINVQNLDALIMIQIDSLTPYQQLLLKIASVIGNVLARNLLESIMYENNWLTTAKAIKRLFAMRILTCANATRAKGSKVAPDGSTSTLARLDTMTCECSFDYDPELCDNLPKYAFCKIMKFRNSNSRKTCYELLPMNQKKEFHSRIINYLENRKQKCPTCGGKVMIVHSVTSFSETDSVTSVYSFELNSKTKSASGLLPINESLENSESVDNTNENKHLLRTQSETMTTSKDDDNDIVKHVSQDTLQKSDKESLDAINLNKPKLHHPSILKTPATDEFLNTRRRSTKKVSLKNIVKKRNSEPDIEDKIFQKLREVTEAKDLKDWHNLGAIDSQDNINPDLQNSKNKPSFCIKIEQGISQIDFRKCTCADLQVEAYIQLIHHALQAELKDKAVDFMLSYCHLNLIGNNTDSVFSKIDEAENLCSEYRNKFNKLDLKRYQGKIYSLRAAACLMSGRITAAKLELTRAFKIYRIHLDNISKRLFKDFIYNIKMKQRKYRAHALLMKIDSVYCLNVATLMYSSIGEDKLSKLTAFKALELIQRVNCPLVDMCDAYSNAIQVELNRGMPDFTADIEKMACDSLKQLTRPVQADEVYAVGKLFMGSFRARTARVELPPAIHSGLRALVISRFLQADNISYDIIPELFYVLLARRRIEEVVDLMQLTLRLSQVRYTHESETWYYALCMDLILDAGFQLENPNDISLFAEFALCKGRQGGPSRRRLVVNLWTYWLRADYEKKAKRFESEALSWCSKDNDDGSLTTLISAMRLAEGMLVSLARKVDDLKKVVDLMELRSIADRELSRLEGDVRLMRTLYPRWVLLRGNSLKLSGRQLAATNLYNQVVEESRGMYNRLEESNARAALSNSLFWAQNARAGVFPQWQVGAEHARSSWHSLMYKMTTTRQP